MCRVSPKDYMQLILFQDIECVQIVNVSDPENYFL